MTTPMIHGDSPRARLTDPLTSHAAGDSSNITGSRRDVLDILTVFGPLPDHEMVELGLLNTTPFTPQRLRSARAELVEAGLVYATGTYRDTPTGRKANVWGVTE